MSYLKLDDYTVPGHGLRVNSSFDFKAQDVSGDASSTALAGQGIKRKVFSVQVFIRYAEAEELRRLIHVAEMRQSGSAKVYTITNDTANSMGVRQVVFSGRFQVDEQESQARWLVSFNLAEYLSIAEMIASRLEDPVEALQSILEGLTAAGSLLGLGGLEKKQDEINKEIGPEDGTA